jgi:hypothetical protein
MAPTVGSSSSSSSASSSRAVKIPHRNALSEEQTSGQSPRIREKGHKTSSRAEARDSSSDSSPTSYSAKTSASEHATAGPSSSSSCSSSFENSLYDPASSISSSKLKAKSTTTSPPNTLIPPHPSPLGPSMASSTSYRSINLNSDFDGTSGSPPHLITYTKTGQGFTWNEELFLPSYMMGRYEASGGRRRRRRYEDDDMAGGDDEGVEIAEIFVSDEEARNMMP